MTNLRRLPMDLFQYAQGSAFVPDHIFPAGLAALPVFCGIVPELIQEGKKPGCAGNAEGAAEGDQLFRLVEPPVFRPEDHGNAEDGGLEDVVKPRPESPADESHGGMMVEVGQHPDGVDDEDPLIADVLARGLGKFQGGEGERFNKGGDP